MSHFLPSDEGAILVADGRDQHPYSVVALIVREDGRVLAVGRKDNPAMLGLPGGKVEDGEHPMEALKREIEEETGCVAIIPSMERIFDAYVDPGICRTYRVDHIWYQPRSMEGTRVEWVTPAELIAQSGSFADYEREMLKVAGLVGEEQ